MQLSIEELGRLEEMFASGKIRSDPAILSGLDQMMQAMDRADQMVMDARMAAHNANEMQAAMDRAINEMADRNDAAADRAAADRAAADRAAADQAAADRAADQEAADQEAADQGAADDEGGDLRATVGSVRSAREAFDPKAPRRLEELLRFRAMSIDRRRSGKEA